MFKNSFFLAFLKFCKLDKKHVFILNCWQCEHWSGQQGGFNFAKTRQEEKVKYLPYSHPYMYVPGILHKALKSEKKE